MPSAMATTPPTAKPISVSAIVYQTCCGNQGAVKRMTSPSQMRLGAGSTSGDTSPARQTSSHTTRIATRLSGERNFLMGNPEVLAHLEHGGRELGRLHEIDRARPRQRHVDHREYPARRSAHHHHAVGEKHRLGDAVRDEDDGLAAFLPD